MIMQHINWQQILTNNYRCIKVFIPQQQQIHLWYLKIRSFEIQKCNQLHFFYVSKVYLLVS